MEREHVGFVYRSLGELVGADLALFWGDGCPAWSYGGGGDGGGEKPVVRHVGVRLWASVSAK